MQLRGEGGWNRETLVISKIGMGLAIAGVLLSYSLIEFAPTLFHPKWPVGNKSVIQLVQIHTHIHGWSVLASSNGPASRKSSVNSNLRELARSDARSSRVPVKFIFQENWNVWIFGLTKRKSQNHSIYSRPSTCSLVSVLTFQLISNMRIWPRSTDLNYKLSTAELLMWSNALQVYCCIE